jgi:hypothetical protein
MKPSSSSEVVQTATQGFFSPSEKLNRVLNRLQDKVPRLPAILQLTFQALALVGLVFFAFKSFTIIKVIGFGHFMEDVFSGLTLQVNTLSFSNGTITVIVFLLALYFLLSLFLLSSSRILCDIAALYCLFFAATMHSWAFADLIVPIATIYAVWVVHRLLLGTCVYRYKRIDLLIPKAIQVEGDENEK